MTPAFLIFVGGGLGAVARYGLSLAATRAFGTGFPWGTFGINISGSLVMGLIAGFFMSRGAPPEWDNVRLFLTTGILGGYTTFSAFSLETILLWEDGRLAALGVYVFGSVLFSIAALFIGYTLAKGLA
jgi:CrcB protein